VNLTFKHIVSHADDLRYASIKVRDLEKKMEEQEWREKLLATHHGYSAIIYVIILIICVYFAYRVVTRQNEIE
jgi:hypothetical protein